MIEAKELRIGNYVKWNGDLVKIGTLQIGEEYRKIEMIIGANQSHQVYLNSCEPILLTPELLEKAGYQYNTEKKQYELEVDGFDSKFPVWMYREEWFIAPMGDDTGHISIEHLHRLQNIVFDLTGKELEINL